MFIEQKQIFHWRRAVRKGREIACCRRLLAGFMLFTVATVAVEAAPQGGVVRQGDTAATISQTPLPDGVSVDTTIDQAAVRVDIDWTGFDTTAAESVTFRQPDSSALAVNRISGNRTRFDGTLTANGRIFLINQNGITFGETAQINAGALLATTSRLDSSTPDDTAHTFSNDGYGAIVNEGDITVSDGGFAVLAAPYVENNGYIKADLGQVELASTNDYSVNVDLRGDGLITFNTPGEFLEDATNPPGVNNSGTLQARSGDIYLSANMVSGIVEGVVNLNGIVDADLFVNTADGTAMVASAALPATGPGGTIKVESSGDINIGVDGVADIHANGGESVDASFLAERDINMGTAAAPAKVTLQADSASSASASLKMIAASDGGAGTLNIGSGVIAVNADATGTSAAATVILEGAEVDINADFDVHAAAETPGSGKADALAVLDVVASGEIEYDTSHNVISYGEPGDLTLAGDIDVSATATSHNAGDSKATANTVLLASGSSDVTAPVDVDANATSAPGLDGTVADVTGSADANAALVITGGTPQGLLGFLRDVSLNRVAPLGTLSDTLTLANLDDVLDFFSFVEDPADFLDRLGGVGTGSVSYTGDSNINALADYSTTGSSQGSPSGLAAATAAGYFAAGGDAYINTDPVKVNSQAYTNYEQYSGPFVTQIDAGIPGVETGARSALVAVAGLHELYGDAADGTTTSTLTVLGALSTTARELASLNGEPDPGSYNQLAAAITALVATGDITVRGADPLADADPAAVQGRASQWQLCYLDQCTAITPGSDGLQWLAAGSAGGAAETDSAHLAQVIIESLYGDIDIQPKSTPTQQVQPAGLFTDPIGPSWPGDLPLRFDSSGRMLAATGIDATRPPQMVALGSSIENAILMGGDPSTLLPPTASGGCLAAGRDAFTISGPDYFDRMISASCEAGK